MGAQFGSPRCAPPGVGPVTLPFRHRADAPRGWFETSALWKPGPVCPHSHATPRISGKNSINPMDTPNTRQCGAKTRSGEPCRRNPAPGKTRCRLHGGAPGSGAPKGELNGNYKHGRYSREKIEERARAMNTPWKPLPPPYRPWLNGKDKK